MKGEPIDPALLDPIDSNGLFVSGYGWVDIQRKPMGGTLWRRWDAWDWLIAKAVYPRYGSAVCAYTLGKSIRSVQGKTSNLPRMHRPPRAGNRGKLV